MKRFVIYEIWTRSRIVEAESEDEAYCGDKEPGADVGDPLSLCNWHAVAIDPEGEQTAPLRVVGGRNR